MDEQLELPMQVLKSSIEQKMWKRSAVGIKTKGTANAFQESTWINIVIEWEWIDDLSGELEF